MKKLNLTLALVLIATTIYAQNIVGDWYGTLNIQTTKLHLVFHISKIGEAYSSTMDSPDQNAFGLATDQTTFGNNQLTIESSKFHLKYTGAFKADSNNITGTFTQGADFPLTLSHEKPTAALPPAVRPQDPKVFPYEQQEVYIINSKAGDKLAGTLTIPTGKLSKIVVLISGSGPQNRNEEILNHRPFLVWSDWLTRQGIAVLRYDDRGIGKSTGNFNTATSEDFADDAEAAVDYIKSRTDLKNLSIGLIGHSEGGMIAPMVASRNKNVDYIVLLAGPGIPIKELMLQQASDQERLNGIKSDVIHNTYMMNEKLYNVVNQHPNSTSAQLKLMLDAVIYKSIQRSSQYILDSVKKKEIADQIDKPLISPWFRYFLAFKPSDYLTKTKCPVLALNGTLDMQVNSTSNLAAISNNLKKAGNKNFKIMPMIGLNHLFQQAKTGSVAEYATNTETINPVALQNVSSWINGL